MRASDDALSRVFRLRISNNDYNRIQQSARALGLSKSEYLRRLMAAAYDGPEEADALLSIDTSQASPFYGSLVMLGYLFDLAYKDLNTACKAAGRNRLDAQEMLARAVRRLSDVRELTPVIDGQLAKVSSRRRLHLTSSYFKLADTAVMRWMQIGYGCSSALEELSQSGMGAAAEAARQIDRARGYLADIDAFRRRAKAALSEMYAEDRKVFGDAVTRVPRLEGGAGR